jgi:ATP-binding cassette subfamily B protein
MYRQDILCRKYNDRDMGFSPKSQIAKWARGPMGALNAASTAVSHIFTAIIYIFVCLKSWGGAFGVGSVTQYIGAISALSGGVSSLVSFFGNMRNNAAFLRTTFKFLDIPNAMYQGSLTTEKRSDKKYEIEFRNIGFKYPSSDEYALRNVSLKFNIGQRLAVVGQNGSGKTTFIKLLCRLYDPTEGEILLNGIDIRKYDYLQYMDIFSVVFQDFKLLSFSLGQNIAAADGYDGDKVKDCLMKVGFWERLQTMDKSLDTCLYKDFEEDGVEISGGEAQKIVLARALYKNAAFIILDEPTAALDPVAEFEVYSKMDEIAGDKTAVFISHRLSSCRFCQNIAVFHEGTVIQRGSHDALIADESGKYHELWTAQAKYYQETSETDEPQGKN